MGNEREGRRLIEAYAADAARRSGLQEPHAGDARAELESHLFEGALRHADGEELSEAHARRAIDELGGAEAVDAAFFAPHRAGLERAPWGRRVGAFLIDLVVIGVASVIIMAPFGTPTVFSTSDVQSGDYECRGISFFGIKFLSYEQYSGEENPCDAFWRAQKIQSYASAGAALLYFAALEGTSGRTLGKMALGIRTLLATGAACGYGAALGRSVTKAFLPLLLLDWLLGLATGSRRQRVSDLAAKTMVVRER